MESYLVLLLLLSTLLVVNCNTKEKNSIKTSNKNTKTNPTTKINPTTKKGNNIVMARSRGGGKNTMNKNTEDKILKSSFFGNFYSSSNETFGHAVVRHAHEVQDSLVKTKSSTIDKWQHFKEKFLNFDLSTLNLANLTQFNTFFNLYSKFFKRNYSEQDRKERFGIILDTVKSIQEHNANLGARFKQGINDLSDMKWSEIVSQKLGLMVEPEPQSDLVQFDGKCGCCWSFAAATVLESHNMKRLIAEGKFNPKKSSKLTVSEQNIIDCSADFGTMGCNGGMPQQAFKFVSAKGVMGAEAYPYKGKKGDCSFDPKKKVDAKIKEGKRIKSGKDDELEKAIYNYGPVSIAVHVTKDLTAYKNGIFEDSNCNPKQINHAVVAVGYTKEYFIVRNSWGPDWGEKGYIRISRSKPNPCGVSQQSYYPIIPGAVETKNMINKLVEV